MATVSVDQRQSKPAIVPYQYLDDTRLCRSTHQRKTLNQNADNYLSQVPAEMSSVRKRAVGASSKATIASNPHASAKPRRRKRGAATAPARSSSPLRRISALDVYIAAAVLLVALPLRLYNISYPDRIVFDEFHFSEFDANYHAGKYLFDIHPPLGKLVLHTVGRMTGMPPASEEFQFDRIGKQFADRLFVSHRAASATFGSLIPPTLFLTCRALDLGYLPSIVGAVLSLTDMLLLIESRLVLTDSQLILYIHAALLCALHLWRSPKRTGERRAWLLATAFFGGCAVSVKWTALVVPGMIAIVSVTGAVFPTDGERLDVLEMLVAGVLAFSIYVASFFVHFRLLPKSGPGDLFMPCWFRSFLQNQTTCPAPGVGSVLTTPPSFLRSFVYLNKEMLRANSAIEQRHHWESVPYQWLANSRGLLYYDEAGSGENASSREIIYLLGNPALAPIVLFSLFACVVWMCVTIARIITGREGAPYVGTPSKAQHAHELDEDAIFAQTAAASWKRRHVGVVAFFLVCYGLNLFPYVAVKRCTFIYHYLPALQHGIILCALALQILVPERRYMRAICCVAIMTAVSVALYVYLPWVYALPRTRGEHEALQLIPGWA